MVWFRTVALLVMAATLGATLARGQDPNSGSGPGQDPSDAGGTESTEPAPPPAPAPGTSDVNSDAMPAPPAESADAAEFSRELRTVEEDVGDLKERVFRSKATLKLLKELLVDASATGSRIVLWHVNKLGGGYSMESVQYFLDGKSVFSKVDPGGSLDTEREIKVHEQSAAPGAHSLQVNMVLRGKGYKVFSYLRTYQFKVQSSYAFQVEQGRASLLRVIADSRGGFRNFVERPTIEYDERTEAYREE
jgi:hypothetical protein